MADESRLTRTINEFNSIYHSDYFEVINSAWSFFEEKSDVRASSSHGAPGSSERRVDYREVLSAEQFEIFAKLREVRKGVAEREAVPVASQHISPRSVTSTGEYVSFESCEVCPR